jgi:N-acetylneuraminate synthase
MSEYAMSKSHRTFIIAEAGVNHNGSLQEALRLVDAAADAGADAVKFQTFRADRLVSRFAPKAEYQLQTTDANESQFEMLRKLELSVSDHEALLQRCQERRIEFMSTPFDIESLSFLVGQLGMRHVKIPSGEITNGPLILEAARSGRPMFLSTGMSTLEEIGDALAVIAFGLTVTSEPPSTEAFRRAFKSEEGIRAVQDNVVVLHCVTEYPAPLIEVNLKAMAVIGERFSVDIGYSDHTLGGNVALAAVALGARVLEKHFTLDKAQTGPDHRASMEPGELNALVKGVREIEIALGSPEKSPTRSEWKNRSVARKSLVATSDIRAGEVYSSDNLGAKRPGTGLSPMRMWDVIGNTAPRNYSEDEPIE